jgi:hypothetical protein
VIRGSKWLVGCAALALLLGLGLLIFAAPHAGRRLTTAGIAAFTLFAALGLLDALTMRIELGDSELISVANFRRRTIPRAEIVSVTWEKGAGVSIRLADRSWVKLAAAGGGSQGVASSIRAWLARTQGDGAGDDTAENRLPPA